MLLLPWMPAMDVLLLSGSGALNLKVLYCLYPLGVRVHVAANSARNVLRYSRHTHRFLHLPWGRGGDDAGHARRLRDYCLEQGIDLVIPGDIPATVFLHRQAHAFAPGEGRRGVCCFPSSDPDTLRRLGNKWEFAQRLREQGLPHPHTRLVAAAEDCNEALAREVGFPLMVKPLDRESSLGVVRIDDYPALRRYLASGAPYSEPPLILQQYVPGTDIDISLLAEGGRVLARAVQQWTPGDVLCFHRHADVERLGEAIVRSFGYSGAAHIDMRIDARDGTVYPIECNPRFWFSMPAAMWAGLNFVEAGIRHCLNRPPAPHAEARGEYRLPGATARRLMRRPWALFSLRRAELRGLLQPLADPLPHWIDYRRNH